MQITRYSDFSLRVLMYLGLHYGRRCTIPEIASTFQISKNHLMKVVQQLGLSDYVKTTRGKHGGLILSRPPSEINIGEVLRTTENNLKLVECFDLHSNKCVIFGGCKLKGAFDEALEAFFTSLEKYTVHDLIDSELFPWMQQDLAAHANPA